MTETSPAREGGGARGLFWGRRTQQVPFLQLSLFSLGSVGLAELSTSLSSERAS